MKQAHRAISLSIVATIGVLAMLAVMSHLPVQVGKATNARGVKMLNSDGTLNVAEDSTRAAHGTGNVPQGLIASDWTSIKQIYERQRRAAIVVGNERRARNYGQQWLTRFDGHGFAVEPDGADWRWGLELQSYGFPGYERAVGGRAQVGSDVERVTYDWDAELQEWFVNDARGLEHGFTLKQRPAGGGERLALRLAVRGGLRPRVQADGRGVGFADAQGCTVINYTGLEVYDADGRALAAGFAAEEGALRLTVEERAARYPITIDPIAQQAYLKASNTGAFDEFGSSVAVSGDTVVVGANVEASNATGVNGDQTNNLAGSSGAVYVFVRSGTTWSQQAYLKASNTEADDRFGGSVAVAGDTVVVGAFGEDSNATGVNGNQADNSAAFAGAAYVFVRSGTTWSQQAYLKASNTKAGDNFGISVAVSGDTVVVGADAEDSNTTGVNGNQADNSAGGAGAAYVFVRSGTTWSQQAYLKASNTGANDNFGYSVAVSGDTVVVGAYLEDSNAIGVNGDQTNDIATDSGAAYVFVRNGTTWSQQAYLKASNTGAFDLFGRPVAVSGDTVVVGALNEASNAAGVNGNQADNSAGGAGTAYVFVRSGVTWSQQAYLKASNTGVNDNFGYSVAVSGDTVVVGAQQEASNTTGVNGNQADNSATNSGAAYVFVRNGTTWRQQAYLKASNTGAGDNFGRSVAVAGDTVVVGAFREASDATGVNGDQTSNSAANSGAVYVFLNTPPTLSVSKSAPSPALTVGQNSTYTVTVTNNGSAAATTATVKDAIPPDFDLISAGGAGWTCTPSSGTATVGTVTCTFSGTIAASGGTNTSLSIVVRPYAQTSGMSVTNRISVDSTGGSAPPNPNICTAADTPNEGCGALVTGTVGCPTSFTVNNLGDAVDANHGNGVCETAAGNGICTLRAAITEANAIGVSGGGCSPFTINFSVTGTINLASFLGALNHPNLTISGPGVNQLTVRRNSAFPFSILVINNGKTVSINNLTISNGANTNGGGIVNSGNLTLNNCAIVGNTASNHGGGLLNSGSMLTVTNCTFSGNTAGAGGGLSNIGGIASVINSTISGNIASGGGGFANFGNSNDATLTLLNSTVAFNTATSAGLGGGIYNLSQGSAGSTAITNLKNTIFANNTSENFFNMASGSTTATLNSQGNNISSDTSASAALNQSGDQNNVNPKLTALGNYGGPTQTHALECTSPAINAGTNTGAPTTDQRGVTRPVGANVDIGAFEANIGLSPTTLPNATVGVVYNQSLTATGGTSPYTFATLSGSLPAGLMLATNGAITGTPTTTGVSTFLVNASDTNGFAGVCPITLTVNEAINAPPTITPAAVTVQQGSPATIGASLGTAADDFTPPNALTTMIVGSPTGVTVSNLAIATNGAITATVVADCEATPGANTVSIKFTDGGNLSTTANFTINVTPSMLNITMQPVSQTVCAGAAATFSVTAVGNGTLGYQWRKGGSPISGATGSSFTIPSAAASDAGSYDVVVTGACNSVTSNAATLSVNATTAITTQPAAQAVCTGSSATFSVVATGVGLTYQWRKNGANISGATSSSYIIPAATAADAANYDVIVSGSCGSVTSSVAALTVNAVTVIATQPTPQTVCIGGGATFSVGATGANLTYQWRKGGVNIPGATSSGYNIQATVAGDAGSYDVLVTGACGTATSTAATLTVNQATAITVQPASQTACEGQPVTFCVTATGTNPHYQWRKNGTNIIGATDNCFTIPAVTAADAGGYDVVVSGSCGTITSNPFSLAVNPAAAIISQPVSLNRITGQSATFSLTATGLNLTYQWRKNGVNIPGATASSYTIASVTPGDAGSYSCVVTGTCGTVPSNAATLNVDCVTVTVSPSSLPGGTVGVAYNQTISATPAGAYNFVVASGALPPGLSLNGSTGAITGTPTAANTYPFSITATDANSCSGAQSYSITICAPPAITTQPADQTVCEGLPATLSVVATGSGLSYQWRKGGVPISGATSSSYTIAATTAADAGSYDVVVTGTCGNVTSAIATLTINTATTITMPPTDQTVCAGTPATFSVVASGTNLTYQWRKGGVNIPGATSSSFTIASTTVGDAGSFNVVVSGSCGSNAFSSAASLTVNTAPTITTQPANQTVCAGSPASFTVTATGAGLSYQWRKGGVNIPGATANSYNIVSATAADEGSYDAAVTGACGTATSNTTTLTVNATTAIRVQPQSQTVCTGAPASFSVTASGTGLSYQWRKNGANIAGATSADYSIVTVNTNDAGSYDVVVVGTCGSVTSDTAVLTVNTPPIITTQPAGQSTQVGDAASFNAAASGNPAPSVQWQVSTDGGVSFSNIPGATTTTLTLNAVTYSQNGNRYRAVFTNSCNTAMTNAATLTVACTFGINPTSRNFPAAGGSGSVNVTAGADCPWTVMSNAVWITPSIFNGTGNGSVGYTVAANTGAQRIGTMTIAGQTFTVTQDAFACPTITVHPLVSNLPNGFVGTDYIQTFTATGGASPYSFAVSAGTLPSGLSLSAGGTLGGTPNATGTFNFTIRATDANGCQGTRDYTVIVSGGLQFYPLAAPVRLLDTRSGAGISGCTIGTGAFTANSTRTQAARTACSTIPANASAVIGNITVVPTGPGFLTLFPSTAAQPTVANSNFAAGEITNNVFTVGLGAGDGAFKIFSSVTTHVIVDVTGYYAPPGTGGLYFHPLSTPVRLLETRAGFTGCFAPGTPLVGTGNPNADPNQDLAVQGRSPVAAPCNSIPASAQVLVGNATSVFPGGGGYLTIYPSGGTRPTVASSNYAGSDVINGPFAVKLGADGKFKIYTLLTTHLVIDILGYYSEEAADENGTGLLFNPLPEPVRLLETRPGGPPLVGCTRTNAPIVGNINAATHTQQARNFCGLPASAQAVVGNVSVVNSAGAGFLTLFPGNLTTAPLVATSNYPAPATFGYNRHFFVGLSPADGTFKVLTQATTDLILDASGYFAP